MKRDLPKPSPPSLQSKADPKLFLLSVEVEAAIINAAASMAVGMPEPDLSFIDEQSKIHYDLEKHMRQIYLERFDLLYQEIKSLIETYSKHPPGYLIEMRGK